jgi:hypothetical protein
MCSCGRGWKLEVPGPPRHEKRPKRTVCRHTAYRLLTYPRLTPQNRDVSGQQAVRTLFSPHPAFLFSRSNQTNKSRRISGCSLATCKHGSDMCKAGDCWLPLDRWFGARYDSNRSALTAGLLFSSHRCKRTRS